MSASQQRVPTRVGDLKVTIIGEGDAGPTAVLWHSLFVDERSWERVVPALSRDRRLILVTGPGHGGSGDPRHRYTMQDCADAALQVLQTLAVEGPVDWVGNAWGGHVGIVLAARNPDRIRTLVTAGTPTHPYPRADRLQTSLLLVLYRLLGPVGYLTDAVAEALLSEHTRTTDHDAVALVRDCFTTADRAGLPNALVSISLRREDLLPLLPAVQAPTLFITGSAHPDWTPQQMQAAAALLPHGSTRVLDGAAYLIPLEAPAEFTRCVQAHWAATPPLDTHS